MEECVHDHRPAASFPQSIGLGMDAAIDLQV